MNKRFVILVGVMVVVALVLMYRASQSGTSHVYTPSQLSDHSGHAIPRMRVAGRVSSQGQITYVTEPRAELRFVIVDLPPKTSVTQSVAVPSVAEPAGASQGITQTVTADVVSGGDMTGRVLPDATEASEGSVLGQGASAAHLPSVPVVYQGLRPDMFAVGRDVIIDGEFKDGVVFASSLLTQCPSKYEAPSPDEKYLDSKAG